MRWPALTALALLAMAAGAVFATDGAGEIYTWTDRDGVVHFGDAPPRSASTVLSEGQAPVTLDEDTPVPSTLNELFAPVDAPGRESIDGANATEDLRTAPIPYQPGSRALLPVPPDPTSPPPVDGNRPAGEPLSVEELEALDPAWLRGNEADATEHYMDERGPFTIGAPLEDPRLPPEQRCAAARRDFEILRDSWPVYRDQGGLLRFQWERDPYRGARRYLEPQARAAALAAARQARSRECATPDDPEAQSAARRQLMRRALCDAERAELLAMESLGSDNPSQSLTDKRALAAQICGDPTSDEG